MKPCTRFIDRPCPRLCSSPCFIQELHGRGYDWKDGAVVELADKHPKAEIPLPSDSACQHGTPSTKLCPHCVGGALNRAMYRDPTGW